MRTHEYQQYFDRHGPEFATEPAPARRRWVALTSQPVGELSLVGVLAEQVQAAPGSQPPETEQQF